MKCELAILTNDGWVVTLVSDTALNFGDAILDSIIVQPYEDYSKRVFECLDDGTVREEYKLGCTRKQINRQHCDEEINQYDVLIQRLRLGILFNYAEAAEITYSVLVGTAIPDWVLKEMRYDTRRIQGSAKRGR